MKNQNNSDLLTTSPRCIGVVGLGYVGLPLAIELSRKFSVVGYDISQKRISELRDGIDRTREVESHELKSTKMFLTHDEAKLADCDFFIITVPTPITVSKQPDLVPLISATKTVAKFIDEGAVVVYESTVYPGCTEEICVPLLEQGSGLKYNVNFFCGYSPERINPGDKERSITKIKKVTSGSTPEAAAKVDSVYSAIIEAGTYKASSIKVAEAAKVIENTQRDINIAFINELSIIFSKLNLDTREVLQAASTKWNFLNFYPGLVGGHCIGVDPYYLTHKAESLGYHPEVILSGRRINDGMGAHVANQTIKYMSRKNMCISDSKVLVLGVTFKENCPDVRNSKVIDVINELKDFGCKVDVYDPVALKEEVEHEYSIRPIDLDVAKVVDEYDAFIIAVGHSVFKDLPWGEIDRSRKVIFDVKGLLDYGLSDSRL